MTLKVGDTIYYFDSNYRKYPPRVPGTEAMNLSCGPIYSEHWRATKITGETSRSWITARGKVAKKIEHPRREGWAFSWGAVQDDIWIHENRIRLQRALSVCLNRYDNDAREKMEALMAIIDFKPEDWK